MIIMRCWTYVNWYNIEKIISYTCVSWSAYKVGSSLMFCWVMNDVQISSFDYIIIFLYSAMIIYINWASHMLHHESIYLLVFSRKKTSWVVQFVFPAFHLNLNCRLNLINSSAVLGISGLFPISYCFSIDFSTSSVLYVSSRK